MCRNVKNPTLPSYVHVWSYVICCCCSSICVDLLTSTCKYTFCFHDNACLNAAPKSNRHTSRISRGCLNPRDAFADTVGCTQGLACQTSVHLSPRQHQQALYGCAVKLYKDMVMLELFVQQPTQRIDGRHWMKDLKIQNLAQVLQSYSLSVVNVGALGALGARLRWGSVQFDS